MYFPFVDMMEKAFKDLLKWFFVDILFFSRELQHEAVLFIETGQTSFRHFEWLNIGRMKYRYPERWKYVLGDFIGAYLKLILLGACVSLLVLASL